MGDLSKNLSRSECACHCGCGFDSSDIETVNVLQDACDNFAVELQSPHVIAHINDWCRCIKHNTEVGGEPNSKHCEARAVDWYIDGITPLSLYDYIDKKYPNKYGLGLYDSRIHLDTRAQRFRWTQQPDGSLKYT